MIFPPPHRLAALVVALGSVAFGGCASFERDWRQAGRQPEIHSFARSDAFTGRWEGRWASAKHHKPSGEPMGGRLRCLLAKLDDHRYEAKFKANWLLFASNYTTVFAVQPRKRELGLKGQHEMAAIFGGIYHYEGRVTPQHFSARYEASYDHGTFEMIRPAENARVATSGR